MNGSTKCECHKCEKTPVAFLEVKSPGGRIENWYMCLGHVRRWTAIWSGATNWTILQHRPL